MPHHIFYSWQSDTPNRIGRGLVEWALERAIRAVKADAEIDPADRELRADSDSAGVPGMPPLADTIFDKIDRAVAFLSDLTHVATRGNGERSPNPNVLLEHGWALKSRGWRAIIGVMNTAMGHPDQHPLPFDLHHFRRPILFDCAEDAPDEARRAARLGLAKALEEALRAILADEVLRAARVPARPVEPHPHDVALLQQFRAQFPAPLRQFLREHSFGTPYLRATLDPLDEMAVAWAGAAFDFEDPVLQDAATALRTANRALVSLVNERIHAMDSNIAMGWAKTDMDVRRGIQPETLAAIGELDRRACVLVDAIDTFEKVARGRIRVAAEPPVPAGPDPRWVVAREAMTALGADRMLGGVPRIVALPSMTLRIVPLAASERPRIDPKAVAFAQRRFPPDSLVRVATDSDERQWRSYGLPLIPTANNPETPWLTRLVRPGSVEFEMTIGERIDNDSEIIVDGVALECAIVEHLGRLAGILASVGLAGPGLVQIAFRGVETVVLARARPGGRRIRKPDLVLPDLEAPDLSADLHPLLHEQFDILWHAAGWAEGSPSFP